MKDFFLFLAGILTLGIIFGFFRLKKWFKNYTIVTIEEYLKMKGFAKILMEKDDEILHFKEENSKLAKELRYIKNELFCFAEIKQKVIKTVPSGTSTITKEIKEKLKEEIHFIARRQNKKKMESFSNLDAYEQKLKLAYGEMKRGVKIPELTKKYGFETKVLYKFREYNAKEVLLKHSDEFIMPELRCHFDYEMNNCNKLDFIVTNMYEKYGKGVRCNYTKIRSIVRALYRNQYMKEN